MQEDRADEPVAIIHNPRAGRGRSATIAERVAAQARARGRQAELLTPGDADAVAATVHQAVGKGAARVIMVGGDGLIHRALPALVDADITVGLVGAGSGNDVIRGLGLGTGTDRQVARALDEPGSPVDVISVDRSDGRRQLALSVVTGGLSGLVNARANAMGFPPGSSRYTVATLLELRRHRARAVDLELDGRPIRLNASLIAVANTPHFGGGMAISPEASPYDGLLDVVIIDDASPVVVASVLPLVYLGRHTIHPAVVTERVRTIEIDPDFPLWADGEPLTEASPGPVRLTADSGLSVAGAGRARR